MIGRTEALFNEEAHDVPALRSASFRAAIHPSRHSLNRPLRRSYGLEARGIPIPRAVSPQTGTSKIAKLGQFLASNFLACSMRSIIEMRFA
jgi:hypothetical protein